MDCQDILRKYVTFLLVLFNFLFVVTGVILVSVGLSVKGYYHEFGALLEDKYFYASDLLILIGVIVFIIAFFGCYGALKKNACMTLTFSTLLIAIFILELIVGVGGFILRHKADEIIEEKLNETMQLYRNPNATEITELWDAVQTEFTCCGIHNYTDWENNTATGNLIPLSCCHFPAGSIGPATCLNDNKTGLYTDGCLDKFSDYIEDHAQTVEAVGLSLALIQLLGIIFSCYLSKQFKSDYETV